MNGQSLSGHIDGHMDGGLLRINKTIPCINTTQIEGSLRLTSTTTNTLKKNAHSLTHPGTEPRAQLFNSSKEENKHS